MGGYSIVKHQEIYFKLLLKHDFLEWWFNNSRRDDE